MSALAVNQHTPADATSGAITLTLPTGQPAGTRISVEKYDSSANAVAVTGNMRGVAAQSVSLTLYRETLGFVTDSSGSWWPQYGHKTLSSVVNATVGYVVTNAQTNGPNILLGGATSIANSAAGIAADTSNGVLLNPGSTGYNNILGGDGSATVGTTTPNVISSGSGAHVSIVGGYDCVAGALSSKILSDHSYTGFNDGSSHVAIIGGANCYISTNSSYCGIFSGYISHITNSNYAIAAGWNHAIDSSSSSAVFGDNHTVTAQGALVSGTTHTVTGAFGRAHGQLCSVVGSYGVGEGRYATSRTWAQRSFAAGKISVAGDVQVSYLTPFCQTTDGTTVTKLGVAGTTTVHNMLRNQGAAVETTVIGVSSGGVVEAAFKIMGVVHFGATGNSAWLGSPLIFTLYNPNSLPVPTHTAGSSAGAIAVNVVGRASTTINWASSKTLVESLAA